MRIYAVAAVVVGLSTLATAAGSIVLTPTTIVLGPGDLAASLTVRNETDGVASFTVRPYLWRNSATGDMQVDATDDLMVYPEIVTLQPGESRRIRLGDRRRDEQVMAERSYRLLLDSVPEPTVGRSAGGLTVRTRLQFSLPVFIQPKDRTARVSIQSPSVAAGRAEFTLVNAGRLHVTPTKIEVAGLGAAGDVVWTRAMRPWYLLAGEVRRFSVDVSGAECRRTAFVTAEATFAEGDRLTLRERRPVSPDAVCSAR